LGINLKDYTREDLIQFEEEMADLFNKAKIKAPIHLYYGNEDSVIEIFRKVRKQDWVFCSWRSHYQCLLKGVPREKLKKEILAGRSISLCFPKERIYSSAMVGGNLPIAVGTALAIQRQGADSKVYCFMGEMTAETGIAHECIKYSGQHQLPIHFIVEDNGKSVCTDTRETWHMDVLTYEKSVNQMVTYYSYETKYPHAGAGVRVQF
jgi:TPP-dependent pyruvate/acetoin dehydrogenase alpha subunit